MEVFNMKNERAPPIIESVLNNKFNTFNLRNFQEFAEERKRWSDGQIIRWSTIYLKRSEHIFTNNIMRITFYLFLKHFSVNLFMWWRFEASSWRLFNKLDELALVVSNFSHKHKSHLLAPQMYAFIAINESIV